MSGLKSKIIIPVNTNNNYNGLDDCIISMFGDSDELENTELEIHDGYTHIPEDMADNNANNNGSEATITRDAVNKMSSGDVFKQSRLRMIEMKIPMVRERKKKTKVKIESFFLEINDKVSKLDNILEIEMGK